MSVCPTRPYNQTMATTHFEALPSIAREERPPSGGTVVMKFGGTSVADPERLKAVAQADRRRPRGGQPGRRRPLGDGQDDRRADRPRRTRSRRRPIRASSTCSSPSASASRWRSLAMAIKDLGHEAISFTGSQAGIVTDTSARQGEDRRDPRPAHPRGAGRGQDRARRRLPGRLDRQGDHHARPRRVGHDGSRAGRGAERRSVRDLHRRRRASSRPTRGSSRRPQAGLADVRGDARAVGVAARR